jgi:hypothetical protein
MSSTTSSIIEQPSREELIQAGRQQRGHSGRVQPLSGALDFCPCRSVSSSVHREPRPNRLFGRFLLSICYVETKTVQLTMSNIVSARQLRAARVLAELTQGQLSTESGFNPRAAKYWESRGDKAPTCTATTLEAIEQTLRRHGVEVFAAPTPGARLI